MFNVCVLNSLQFSTLKTRSCKFYGISNDKNKFVIYRN